MQHTVLDTLLYLFDYLVYEKKTRPTVDEMHEELGAAGFAQDDIDRALAWLSDLNDLQEGNMLKPPSRKSIRQFTALEMTKISEEGRGFLYQLTQMGVIDTRLREILIQKLMVLDEEEISLDDMKWVTLMAIFNRPGCEAESIWLEQLIMNESKLAHPN